MHRCEACETLYLDPRPTPESIIAAYQDYYTHAAGEQISLAGPTGLVGRLRNDYLGWKLGYSLPRRHPAGRWILRMMPVRRRRYERLIRHLPRPEPGARILDVGCGNGEFLARLREIGWDVFGFEVDPEAVAATRALGIPVVDGALGRALAHGPYHVVTSSHVLEHVHDPINFLETCRSLLAPSGRLWMATPNIESVGFRRYGAHWMGLDCPRHLVLFSRRSLALALERAGFSDGHAAAGLGFYGMLAESFALHRRLTHRTSAPVRRMVEEAAGSALMWAVKDWGEELIATASA